MALLTPPSTLKKKAGFFQSFTPQVYYEDIRGTRNPDEELDKADVCESESDDEDEAAIEKSLPGYGVFPSKRGATVHEVTDHVTRETQYRIAPHVKSKTSIPVTPGKQLTPKKFGMFAAYDPLDATVVSDAESGDEEEHVVEEFGVKSRRTDGRQTEKALQHRGSRRGAGKASKSPAQQKRKRSSVVIARPKTRGLISQEIAEHARERKAALRAGRASSGRPKAAIPNGPVRQPIVSEYCSEDELNATDESSKPRARNRREMVERAREVKGSRGGGRRGPAASAPRDKSFREVGDPECEELVERKLWVMVETSNVEMDEYVE